MSDISSSDAEKPMEQPEHDLSKAMGQLTVTSADSYETSPSLSDMPIDAVVLITEKLDYKDQLKLRKVSKSLRALVDKLKPACKSIFVLFCSDDVTVDFDEHRVTYKSYHEYRYDEYDLFDEGIIVERDDFEKVALDDLASNLKNPKLKLEDLDVRFSYLEKKYVEKYCNEIRKALECMNHQVSVKEINLTGSSPFCLLSILPYLKPGVLEIISLDEFDSNSRSTGMDQVALLEQWKQAEKLELWRSFDGFPLKYATHFKRFKFQEMLIDEEIFIRIKNFLSELDNFEHCILSYRRFSNDPDSVHQVLGEPVSSNTTEEIFHHPIPDSDCFFEIKKSTDSTYIYFHITKKNERVIVNIAVLN